MRAVVQRVDRASVTLPQPDADPVLSGEIGKGLLVLVGVGPDDTETEVDWLARKIVGLRIFQDPEGKMNLDVRDVGGAILAVSQFTLYGDCRKGRRPSFVRAAHPEKGEALFDAFCARVRDLGLVCETGKFGANMNVSLLNQGPVTMLIDTEKTF